MSLESHIGQILPVSNEARPLSTNTTFYANYDNDMWGYSPTNVIKSIGHRYALNFNGTNTNVNTMYGNAVNPFSSTMTIEMWVKAASIGTNMYALSAPNGTNQRLYLSIASGKWDMGIQSSADTSPVGSTNATIEWTHLALTFNAGTVNLYVNSVFSFSKTYTTYALAGNLLLGGNAGFLWNGLINEYRVWNSIRTQTQLKDFMFTELDGDEPNLIGYLKLNEGMDLLAHTSCFSGSDGLISGAPSWSPGYTCASIDTSVSKFGGSVKVEETTTNLIANTTFTTSWTGSDGSIATLTQNVYMPKWNTKKATRIQTTGGTTTLKYVYDNGVSTNAIAYALSVRIKNQGLSIVTINNQLSGGSTTVAVGATADIAITSTGDGSTNLQFRIETAGTSDLLDVIMYQPQLEAKAFASSFVNGTRVLPSLKYPATVLNDNAGTISFWGKHIASPANWSVGSADGYYLCANENYTSTTQTKNTLALARLAKSTTTLSLITADLNQNKYQKDIALASDTNWHHYAITWDKTANYIGLYVDAVQKVYEAPTYWFTTFAAIPFFCIGSYYSESTSSGCSNMNIDELRIDKIAAAPDEIMSWYYANAPFIAQTTSELSY